MKFGTRTRTALSLTLGVLAGLGLIILPGGLAPSLRPASSATAGTGSNSTSGTPSTVTIVAGPKYLLNLTYGKSGGEAGNTIGSLLLLVSLVLVPALALSFIARTWAMKRAKRGFGRNPESETPSNA